MTLGQSGSGSETGFGAERPINLSLGRRVIADGGQSLAFRYHFDNPPPSYRPRGYRTPQIWPRPPDIHL
jgi:hypothetical protein